MESQNLFTPLADISRQPLKVGTPPDFLFTENGTRIDRELVALSIQLRTAEALEKNLDAKRRWARLSVLSNQKGAFCAFITELAAEWGRSTPEVKAIEDRPGVGAIMTVEFDGAEELFYLGTRWQQRQDAMRKVGGLTHE